VLRQECSLTTIRFKLHGFATRSALGNITAETTLGFEGTLSADAAGITVCLFTFSHLSFQQPSEDVFSRHFYALREFALDHKEVGSIFAAID